MNSNSRSTPASRFDFRTGGGADNLHVTDQGVTILKNGDEGRQAETDRVTIRRSRMNANGEVEFAVGSVFDKGSPLEKFAESIGFEGEILFGEDGLAHREEQTEQTESAPSENLNPPKDDEGQWNQTVEEFSEESSFASRVAANLLNGGAASEYPPKKRFAFGNSGAYQKVQPELSGTVSLAKFCPHCAYQFGSERYCPDCGTRRQEYAPNLS
jgi:hypothetical protein